eukprot:2812130-Prymnesium_polylepis.1
MADASLPPMHGTSFVLGLAVQGGFAPRPRARLPRTRCVEDGDRVRRHQAHTRRHEAHTHTRTREETIQAHGKS